MYKGFVDDKLRPGLKAQPLAVKQLDLDGLQGHREWLVSLCFFFFVSLHSSISDKSIYKYYSYG